MDSRLQHYRRLWFFARHRTTGNNYATMRKYFADILVEELEQWTSVRGKRVLDVGGANGEFCEVLEKKFGADATNIDLSPGVNPWKKTVTGSATNLPFGDHDFDLILARGILEHIPDNEQLVVLREMFRVCRNGGWGYVTIPPWYNQHAGHFLKPFHILPFSVARRLRKIFFGNWVEGASYADVGLYKISVRRMERLIRKSGFTIIAVRDTHFRNHRLAEIPVIREFAVPAISYILQKKKKPLSVD